jgi:hypothetical protein
MPQIACQPIFVRSFERLYSSTHQRPPRRPSRHQERCSCASSSTSTTCAPSGRRHAPADIRHERPVPPSGPGSSGPQGSTQTNSGLLPGGQPAAPPPTSGEAKAPPSFRPPTLGSLAPSQTAPGFATSPPPSRPWLNAAQIEKIETAAREGDLQECRNAAQDMRKAGITMPAELLALAALNLRFFEVGQSR